MTEQEMIINKALINIYGECLKYDLSADQLRKIYDKKYEVWKKLQELMNTIKRETEKYK